MAKQRNYKALYEKLDREYYDEREQLRIEVQIATRQKNLAEHSLSLSKKREENLENELAIERATTDRLVHRLMALLAQAVPTIGKGA